MRRHVWTITASIDGEAVHEETVYEYVRSGDGFTAADLIDTIRHGALRDGDLTEAEARDAEWTHECRDVAEVE